MLDVIEQTTELPLETVAGKRARIEAELQGNPNRSDREIARVVGCDHKTVGNVRGKLSPPESPARPTPTEFRSMLIEAGKDFDANMAGETAEEVVDRMIADGKISYATAGQGRAPVTSDDVDRPDDHWKKDNADLLFWDQPATVCYWNRLDQVVIKQQADPYEESDPFLRFAPENLPRLIARLQQIYDDWRGGR